MKTPLTTFPLLLSFLLPCTLLAAPSPEGLAFHIDASDAASVDRSAEGKVTAWRDLISGNQAKVRGNVSVITNAVNGLDVLRFGANGVSAVDFPAWHDAEAPISLFIVWQRTAEQADGKPWQRMVTCKSANDKKGFAVAAAMRGQAGVIEPVIYTISHAATLPLPITFGSVHPPKFGNHLRGDLAEVLIYNRRFHDPDEFHAVEQYLMDKWSCRVDPKEQGWLRPDNNLPPVKHANQGWPMHDQPNAGKWDYYGPWSDEFNADTLDPTRWTDYNPNWHGRAPARFLPRNVSMKDGNMGITMSHDAPTEHVRFYGTDSSPYHTWAAASVVSREARTYGAFEIRSKAMRAIATSAWWFMGTATNAVGEVFSGEIDVFEIGGSVPKEEARCGGNLHLTKKPGLTKQRSMPAGWFAPFHFADAFHVFGLDWGPEYIRWYLDGIVYRSVRNTDWHTPQRMIFDTEIWSWWPDPVREEFPATFTVDYVRAWTREDWPEPKGVCIKPTGNGVTKALRRDGLLPEKR